MEVASGIDSHSIDEHNYRYISVHMLRNTVFVTEMALVQREYMPTRAASLFRERRTGTCLSITTDHLYTCSAVQLLNFETLFLPPPLQIVDCRMSPRSAGEHLGAMVSPIPVSIKAARIPL